LCMKTSPFRAPYQSWRVNSSRTLVAAAMECDGQ
jgi:hypothetical protein